MNGLLRPGRTARSVAVCVAATAVLTGCVVSVPGPGGIPLNAPGDVRELVPPDARVVSVDPPQSRTEQLELRSQARTAR